MLGALAAIALAVGSIAATATLTEDRHQAAAESRKPVVEVQTIERVDTAEENFGL
ncbi:MAG: hypothetical protein LJE70_13895 [Chromatiaceae bacterium]|jgi:hypothetical protein|nr:hypothetical protein [Chromatiaceae bacterium]